MPINIEIKSRCNDFTVILDKLAHSLGITRIEMDQEDTFFNVPRGKLKMRCDKQGQCELIYYRRTSSHGIMTSSYHREILEKPEAKAKELQDQYGVAVTVRKHRIAFISGDVRIHLDEVESLGRFLEVEILANRVEQRNSAKHLACQLIRVLGISRDELIDETYEDLLIRKREPYSAQQKDCVY